MKKLLTTILALAVLLVGCSQNSSSVNSIQTITGTYHTPTMAPDYIMIKPNNQNISSLTVDYISPTNDNLLELFKVNKTENRNKDCEYVHGTTTVTIRNLNETVDPYGRKVYQAEIVTVDKVEEPICGIFNG